jgi:hypothetical protein
LDGVAGGGNRRQSPAISADGLAILKDAIRAVIGIESLVGGAAFV